MENYFWEVLEKDLIHIPDHIKEAFAQVSKCYNFFIKCAAKSNIKLIFAV